MNYIFKSNGTEGMLDVILSCTLIFMLMSALVQVDSQSQQEVTLPDMELSQSKDQNQQGGDDSIGRVTISLKKSNQDLECFIDDKQVDYQSLESELKSMQDISHVALRREPGVSCGIEDQVILTCQELGIHQVAIVLKSVN
ncbi:biopolymer transporter ExbD [Lentisphaera profundi]|uniref:Biopolymer transporter ExbD n=1 Tax=Lentisphaera profundi TaxID=1658616 RepID=A0ABY7VTP4_9BACT|nr:biopolymer transporter ExbD [Lentisphaera profundi]WDE96638.1 biopolymer transporter ExbD [Lentisphaera profundi]